MIREQRRQPVLAGQFRIPVLLLLEHVRNLAVAKVSDGRLLPDLPDEETKVLREQAARLLASREDA